MFLWLSILLAAYFVWQAFPEYKIIAGIVCLEFVLHKLAVTAIPSHIQYEFGWSLFLSYALINLLALYLLKRYKAHFFIVFLIFINMSYNILIVLSYFKSGMSVFYYNFVPVARTIMIFELAYLAFIGKSYVMLTNKHNNNGYDHIDRLFCVRPVVYNRGFL